MVSKRDYLLVTVLVVVTCIAYSPALNGGLLMDDAHRVRAFWPEYRLWGSVAIGYHLISVLLHAGSALLLVAVVRQLEMKGAWLAGFLFALHPLCVESVAWISEQENPLSTLLYMAAALSYLRFDRSRERRSCLLALAFFALALLSNSVTATLPIALLVVFWWKRGKVEIRPLAPFLAVGVAMAIYTTGHDFVHAGHAVWFYLLKIIVPFGYTFIYPAWTDVNLLWPLSVVAAIAGLVWYAPGNRAPLAAFLIFIVTLIPVLGFPNVRDHFLYLASPVIIVLCAQFIPERAGALLVAGLGVLTFLHAGVFRDGITLYTDTIERNPDAWEAHNKLGAALLLAGKVPEAIPHLQTALQLQPQDPDIHYNLGVALASIPEYQTALRLKNDFPEAHNNLGRELAKLPGHQAEGISHIERALALNPDFADAHVNLGIALSRVPGRKGEALDQLEAGLRLDPNVPGGRHAYELLLSATPGRARESISYFETQTRQHPDSAESQNALGNALRGEPDHVPEAILHFREALRLAPNMVEARMNLANTLAQFPDRQSEAIQEYRYVLKLNPHFPEVHNNMGNALVATNRTAEAALEFEAAIADDPTSANPHVNLGAIYFNTPGRLNEATREFETAVKLDPNLADAHTNLGLAYLQAPGQEKNAQALAEFEASLRLKPDPELKRRVEQLKLAIANQNPNFKLN